MQCKAVRDALLHAHDQPPTDDERAAVSAHLATCVGCRRFAEAMHVWGTAPRVAGVSPDLTERVLASVRPLPPPWVYHQARQEKQMPQLVAFTVGVLGVTMTFVALALALIVGVESGGAVTDRHATMTAIVGIALHQWMDSLPDNTIHAAITVVGLGLFAALLIAWFRTLASHTGRDA